MKMKSLLRLTLATLCGCLLLPSVARAQALPFTYQGKLEKDGVPYTGNVDILLGIYDDATGSNWLDLAVIDDTPVKAGVFTVTFTPSMATGFFRSIGTASRWLQIAVKPPGQDYTVLSPRQQITYAPYAMHAAVAEQLIGDNSTVQGNLSFGSSVRQMLNLWDTQYGIGVQANTLYQRSNSDFSWFKGGVHNDNQNNPGAGGAETMRLTGGGTLTVEGPAAGFNVLNRSDPSKFWALYADNNGTDDTFRLWSGATGDRVTVSQSGRITLATGGSLAIGKTSMENTSGILRTGLRINAETTIFYNLAGVQTAWLGTTGDLHLKGALFPNGADVAEGFDVSGPDTLEPGSVVVIDADHPGKLKLSATACDKRVAGIISGAGGVNPGLRLGQPGIMEGDHNVSLTGRVYVKADASQAAIAPGDLLTTSDLPGHAMKVTDHEKSQGAVLGKAMSRLPEGSRGLVLVLVTLQ